MSQAQVQGQGCVSDDPRLEITRSWAQRQMGVGKAPPWPEGGRRDAGLTRVEVWGTMLALPAITCI